MTCGMLLGGFAIFKGEGIVEGSHAHKHVVETALVLAVAEGVGAAGADGQGLDGAVLYPAKVLACDLG